MWWLQQPGCGSLGSMLSTVVGASEAVLLEHSSSWCCVVAAKDIQITTPDSRCCPCSLVLHVFCCLVVSFLCACMCVRRAKAAAVSRKQQQQFPSLLRHQPLQQAACGRCTTRRRGVLTTTTAAQGSHSGRCLQACSDVLGHYQAAQHLTCSFECVLVCGGWERCCWAVR